MSRSRAQFAKVLLMRNALEVRFWRTASVCREFRIVARDLFAVLCFLRSKNGSRRFVVDTTTRSLASEEWSRDAVNMTRSDICDRLRTHGDTIARGGETLSVFHLQIFSGYLIGVDAW